jgi:hypothetical protein
VWRLKEEIIRNTNFSVFLEYGVVSGGLGRNIFPKAENKNLS